MNKTSLIISIILIISLALNVHQCNRDRKVVEIEKEIIVEKCDTIVNYKYITDTIYNIKKETDYKYITVNDTLYIENKPELFKDSTDVYDIEIQSVKLDWYKLNIHHTDTITYEKEIIKNIYNKPKKQHFTHGIQVGVGYGVWYKRPDLYVGYGVQFNF